MALVKRRELKRRYELDGPQKTVAHIQEAVESKELAPTDFSIRDLAEAVVPDGSEWVRSLDPREAGGTVMEAGDGVDVTAFSNITNTLISQMVMDAYQNEQFIASQLIPSISTRLNGEKLAGVAGIGDVAQEVHPGMPYQNFGFGEDYTETPATTKRGFIIPVTKEAIFFDQTGQVLRQASNAGESLGLNKEKRLLDTVIGVTNNYKWKGTTYNTYLTSGNWINSVSSNELVDWTDVDAAEQLMADILDPNTSEPVLVLPDAVLVCPAYRNAAARIFGAAELRYSTGSAATQVVGDNPYKNKYPFQESRLMYRRIIASGVAAADAKKYWFVGNFAKAFAYMENWPISVVQAPVNSEAEFTQDIILRFKASERGAAAVLNPRYVVKCTG